ncbi:MAG: hypothetical protein ACRDO4_00435 [Nocardioides sp.]
MRGLGSVLVCGVAAVLVGCSDPAPKESREPTAEPGTDLRDFQVADMLAELPASLARRDDPFVFYAGDLARASELAGMPRPDALGETGSWIAPLAGGDQDSFVYVPLDIPLAPRYPAPLIADDLHWSVLDVYRFASWTQVAQTTTVARGSFDDETLAELPSADGIHTAGKGADLKGDLASASPARPQGIPLRMATSEDWLIASPETPVVEDWVAGAATLADLPVLAELAAALDENDVYAAVMTTPEPFGTIPLPPLVIEELRLSDADFPRFIAYAVGWSVEDERAAMTVAYHLALGEDADRARNQVADLWNGADFRLVPLSRIVEVDEVTTRDGVVAVRLSAESSDAAAQVAQMVDGGDLPFMTR